MNDIKELDEGSVIGNYRVIRLLGQGGMGTVYEVDHLEAWNALCVEDVL